jgi:protein-disulfide isomerase
MDLRKASPYLVAITFVLVLVLLFQVNALSDKLDSVTIEGGSDSDSAGVATAPSVDTEEDSEPVDVNVDGDSIVHGDPDTAAVVIVEYSDFECPFCGRAQPTVEELIETYGDDIAVVYKDFPLGFHPDAQPAAVAAECADEQGMFREYHDLLFANQDALDDDSLLAYAEEVGLDVDEWSTCYDNEETLSEVEEDYAEGVADGVRGTPAFFVNGVLISGAQPASVFEAEIDKYL